MATFERHVDVEWQGSVMDGKGEAKAGTGAFSLPVTFPARIGDLVVVRRCRRVTTGRGVGRGRARLVFRTRLVELGLGVGKLSGRRACLPIPGIDGSRAISSRPDPL